ncbi:MAG TPA: PEP-CTERM sorting domain-containing protein [Caulobacteraceae bacterium]|nr:PEP-CTERM sorting domain-containing protein [Caulobacteraceae bacterium]
MQTRDMLMGVGLAAAIIVPAAGHAATLIGDSVHAMYLFPDSSTVLQDLGVQVVGASTPTFANVLGANVLNVDVTASQIVFSWIGSNTALTSAFNGIEFTDLTHPFTAATLDAVSNTPGVALSFFGGNVFLNVSGVTYQSGQNVTIDVSTEAVPEPAGWTLMLLGLGGLGTATRARRRAPAIAS